MKRANGKKAWLLKTWGIHALHHGWSYDEVMAMYSKMAKKTIAEIVAWTREQRQSGWPKGS